MWPDRVSNQGLLTYESGALPTALRGPAMPQLGESLTVAASAKFDISNDFPKCTISGRKFCSGDF